MSRIPHPRVAAGGLLLALAAGATQAQAQPPAPGPVPASASAPRAVPPPRIGAVPGDRPPADRAPEQSFQGTVRRYLLTPAGDVDGLLLEDGTQVDVPPHLSARVTEGIHVHDRVEVTGTRAPDSKLVRAAEIRDATTSRAVRVDGPPRATPPSRAAVAPALAPMTASGPIVALLYTPHGDIGGALTQDGTQVRFPPQAPAGRGLAVGKAIYARGFGTAGPNGRAMDATAVGSTEHDAQAVFSPPAPRPGLPPAPGGPGHDAGPPPRPDADAPPALPPADPTPPRPPVDAAPAAR